MWRQMQNPECEKNLALCGWLLLCGGDSERYEKQREHGARTRGKKRVWNLKLPSNEIQGFGRALSSTLTL